MREKMVAWWRIKWETRLQKRWLAMKPGATIWSDFNFLDLFGGIERSIKVKCCFVCLFYWNKMCMFCLHVNVCAVCIPVLMEVRRGYRISGTGYTDSVKHHVDAGILTLGPLQEQQMLITCQPHSSSPNLLSPTVIKYHDQRRWWSLFLA